MTLAYIGAFCILWWGIYTWGRTHLDGRDMVENFAWGMQWQWGNDKHPPLFGWITAAWFTVFPFSDGSYYLLNQVNLAIALCLLALAMRRLMGWDRVLIAIVLTSLGTRFGPDSGFKYNANSALLPFVAGLVWALLHALQGGRMRWFVIAGIFAAGMLLTKYYALVMLAAIGLALHMALRPAWRVWLKGSSLAAGTAALLTLPHLLWSMRNHWPAVRYMHASHTQPDWTLTAWAHATMLGDCLHLSGFALLVWGLSLLRVPRQALVGDAVAPRLGLPIVLLGIALTVSSALVQNITPVSPWLIPVFLFTGWALVDLTPAGMNIRVLARRVGLGAALYLAGNVVVAVLLVRQHNAYPAPTPYDLPQTVAQDATRLYRQAYRAPPQFVAGTFPLPFTLSFYSPDHPTGLHGLDLPRSTWIDRQALQAGNKIVVCGTLVASPRDDPGCPAAAAALFGAPDLVRQLVYPVYDPASRQPGVQRYDVLMWRPPGNV